MGNELGQHVNQSQKTGVLQLRNFKLTKVPDEVQQVAQYLRTLDLSTNRLRAVEASLFRSLVQLKVLQLNENKLELLPNEIECLIKLETLSMSNNLLTRLPPTTKNMKALRKIYLSNNQLADIPAEICQLKLLDHLDLSNNFIEAVKDYVKDLDCIEVNLNSNKIKSISPNIAQSIRLKVLRLDNNGLGLKAIPTSLLKDSKVCLISLEGNSFNLKQFQEVDGYEAYMERYTATKRKFE